MEMCCKHRNVDMVVRAKSANPGVSGTDAIQRFRIPTGSGKPEKPEKNKISGKVMESHGTLKNHQESWKSHGT